MVDSSLSTLTQSNNYLNLAMTNVEDLSIQIMFNRVLQDYFDYDGTDDLERFNLWDEANSYMISLVAANKLISNICFIENEGNVIGGSGSLKLNGLSIESLKNTKYYTRVFESKNKPVWYASHSNIDSSPNSQNYSMCLIRGISSLNTGEEKGILIIDVRKDVVQNLINQIDLGQNSQIHMVSPDGKDLTKTAAATELPAAATEKNECTGSKDQHRF